MANVQFVHLWNRGDGPHIAVGQAVTGVQDHSQAAHVLGGLDKDLKLGLLMHWGPYSQWGIVESWSLCAEDEP